MLGGETGWTTPCSSKYQLKHSGSGMVGLGSEPDGLESRSALCSTAVSGAGSALGSGGRSNFFFGAEYSTLADKNNCAERAKTSASKLASGRVDSKSAALLGVADSAGRIPAKAQKMPGVVRHAREGGVKSLALQDVDVSRI